MATLMSRDSVPGLAKKLRAAREAAGLSQGDLAERSGVPSVNISRFENDHKTPTISTLLKLATALGVEVADLLPKTTGRKSH